MLSGNKSKKRKPSAHADGEKSVEPTHSTWAQRQAALKLVSEFELALEGGGSVFLCSKCDPKSSSGSPDALTIDAVKAFQAISGIPVSGEWGHVEEQAMRSMLEALGSDPIRIECDPLVAYPAPFGCFVHGDAFYLALADELEAAGQPHLLTVSGSCEHIEATSGWHDELKAHCISSALLGATDPESARVIVESLLSRHAPECVLLGRENIGSDAAKFWDDNLNKAAATLEDYEYSAELLEKDAKRFGLR